MKRISKPAASTEARTNPEEKQPLVLKPALALFGTDRSGKPHAAWFAAEEAEAARTAAGLTGYHVLALTTEAQAHVAATLARGRLFENGRALVPFVKAALYETLSKMVDAAAPTSTEAAPADVAAPQAAPADASAPAPEPVRSLPVVVSPRVRRGGPKDWDEIEPGSLVLAYDG